MLLVVVFVVVCVFAFVARHYDEQARRKRLAELEALASSADPAERAQAAQGYYELGNEERSLSRYHNPQISQRDDMNTIISMKSFSKVTICMLLVVIIASQASEAARFKNADKAHADREFLELCAQGSGQEIIKALKNGANPNARDQEGNSAAEYILKKHNFSVVKALFDAGLNFDVKYYRMYELAAKYNPDPDVIAALVYLGHGELEDYQMSGLLNAAAGYNNAQVVKKLIELGIGAGSNPLFQAAKLNKDAKVIEALIDAGVEDKFDQYGMNALMYAAQNNNIPALKALLEAGTYINAASGNSTFKYTALSVAVQGGELSVRPNLEAIEYLIKAGADVNKGKCFSGGPVSALQYAKSMLEYVRRNNGSNDLIRDWNECIKLLTRAGAK